MRKNYAKVIAATLLFGSIGLFVRAIPLASSVIALVRAVIGALVLLLAPAAAFWVLVGLGALIPHGYGLTIAAALLNSPAYGLFTRYMVTTGWGITAPPWAGYVGALVSGLLPPLLYLIGSYLPIRALDEAEENVEI